MCGLGREVLWYAKQRMLPSFARRRLHMRKPLAGIPFSRRGGVHLYWLAGAPIYRLLLRVGIKVADEGLISWGYVRSSNIYVRGSLGLRTWSLRLRAWMQKNHYVKVLFLHEKDTFPSAG